VFKTEAERKKELAAAAVDQTPNGVGPNGEPVYVAPPSEADEIDDEAIFGDVDEPANDAALQAHIDKQHVIVAAVSKLVEAKVAIQG
jgi:hypothetical protein